MDALEIARLNLLSPVVLAFVLGVFASLVKSDLEIPQALYDSLAIYLLLAIGLKGGAALAVADFAVVWKVALATIAVGAVSPLVAYAALRGLGRLDIVNAAAVAAHYGSVSAVTFIASVDFAVAVGTKPEGFMPALVALLEVPGIVVALGLASRRLGRTQSTGAVVREILFGKSIVCLMGGLVIGFVTGPHGLSQVEAFFVTPFKGALTLFLLELGMVAAKRFRDLRAAGPFLLGFAIVMPVVLGLLGIVAGSLAGLGVGGAGVLGAMVASASYIAAPAAVRMSLPEANPTYYLTMSLGITFPFNLTIGIPLYHQIALRLHGLFQ
ncbi:MAG: sodium-dependent bicarbonate transport family permease [Myxococcales bacterium]|nr:sodium-dependent bicarbonate transport family permease [Myxococcales bacterium]